MTEYRRALPHEEADILDFINYVFSQAHRPHNFKTLLPKVYAHDGFHRYHYVAVQDGKIRATVAVMPAFMPVGNNDMLKIGYVGSVSVHPYARGEGHMKKLMHMMLEDAEKEGYDLLALGGQRQRYQYFGFERGGAKLCFTVNQSNIRHALPNTEGRRITVREITDNADAALDEMHSLSSAQSLACLRERENYLEIMQSWQGKLYALEENGALLGYLYGKERHFLAEIALRDESCIGEAIKAYMQYADADSVTLRVDPLNRVRINYVKSFAEKWELSDNEMLRVINWRHTLSALLSVKADCLPLCDGRIVIEIEGAGRFAMAVKDHQASLEETDEPADMVMTPLKAVEFFFSPYTAMLCTSPMLKSWLPVPFGMYPADEF